MNEMKLQCGHNTIESGCLPCDIYTFGLKLSKYSNKLMDYNEFCSDTISLGIFNDYLQKIEENIGDMKKRIYIQAIAQEISIRIDTPIICKQHEAAEKGDNCPACKLSTCQANLRKIGQ